MKKKIIVSLALALVLSFTSLTGTHNKAEAADWVTTGSIFKTYWHSGSFSNYVYQRTITTTALDNILAGVKAHTLWIRII